MRRRLSGCRRRVLLWRGALPAALVAVTLSAAFVVAAPAAPAQAESADQARDAARRAAADVAALHGQSEEALADYATALDALATSVSTGVAADRAAEEADTHSRDAASLSTARVRALYMDGGGTDLLAGVLDAGSLADLAGRTATVERILVLDDQRVVNAARTAAEMRTRADSLHTAADLAIVTASDVDTRSRELQGLIDQQERRLSTLSARARGLAEAEAAAEALRRLRERAAAAAAARLAAARAAVVPTAYAPLYRTAATTCPGLPWSVLAAIGQVESGHGRNVGPSPHGAMGPMQFLPSTFAAYYVDGDQDGDAEIGDPADAVYSAARYLCANGGGAGQRRLERAIWHYNHAEWYVRLVVSVAAQIAGRDGL